ncbi:hypothetical protein ACHAWF_018457 [Thalassiosira exigua]
MTHELLARLPRRDMVLSASGRRFSRTLLSRYLSSRASSSDATGGDGPRWVVTGSLSGDRDAPRLVPPSGAASGRKAPTRNQARLLVSGPDASGLVASFSQLLFKHGCGIVDCTSESSEDDDGDLTVEKDCSIVPDHHGRMFFQRILFDYSKGSVHRDNVEKEIQSMCQKFGMESQLAWGGKIRKMAIFVSKYDHCLWELLLRHRAGELSCEIPLIVSNHENLRSVAETFDVPYRVFPISKETKLDQEQKQMELLQDHGVDLVVLARYMQVLTPAFCDLLHNRIINIHHSFLPAFMGGMPYHRAHERGVKLIGATAHYATTNLDQGPIIEQDIMRVSHRDDVKDLIRKGRTLEKNVLVSAVKAHLEDRIIVHRNKCIVFAE